jgi:uncharacterized protein YacL
VDIISDKKKNKVSWKKSISLVIPTFITSFIIFLMLEVVWADIVRENIQTLEDDGQYTPINFILFIGIFSIFFIGLLVSFLIMRDLHPVGVFITNLVAFMLTLISFGIFALIYLQIAFPDAFGELSFYRKMLIFPNYYSYIAIYLFPSPVFFWFAFQLVYNIFVLLILRLTIFDD